MTIRRKPPTNKSPGTRAGNKPRRDRAAGNEPGGEQRKAAAEELAIAALGFIAAEPERLGRFLAITGIGPDSIRDAAREPRFLAGVLDHVAADETLLLAFAAEYEIDPDTLMRAREVLAGGRWERDTP
jgi:Protein of unknown function (DUF3572)